MTLWRRWGLLFAQLALPVLIGLLAAPRVEVGATLLPWAPAMADLDVYLHIGQVVLSGGDIIDARAPETGLAFVYPPFAALLCVPLALLPVIVVQLGWVLLCVLALYATFYRLGLSGWVLSSVTAAAVWLVEPVHATIGFGQLGIVLVALVVLDLVPGRRLGPWLLPGLFPPKRVRTGTPADAAEPARCAEQLDQVGPPGSLEPAGRDRQAGQDEQDEADRVLRRTVQRGRWLPEGCWVGLAVALKLTPGLFVVMLLLAGRRRVVAALSGVAVATFVVGALVFPSASIRFVGGLVSGNTRTTEGLHYLTNQSLLGALTRITGGQVTPYGLALAALTALFGAWVAARIYRQGRVLLAVSLCGVATLLASPISWTHHFVWVAPLAIALLGPGSRQSSGAPLAARRSLRATGWLFVGWVSAAVFLALPYGDNVEVSYGLWQLTISVATPVLGLAVVVAATLDARRPPAVPPLPSTPHSERGHIPEALDQNQNEKTQGDKPHEDRDGATTSTQGAVRPGFTANRDASENIGASRAG